MYSFKYTAKTATQNLLTPVLEYQFISKRDKMLALNIVKLNKGMYWFCHMTNYAINLHVALTLKSVSLFAMNCYFGTESASFSISVLAV